MYLYFNNMLKIELYIEKILYKKLLSYTNEKINKENKTIFIWTQFN